MDEPKSKRREKGIGFKLKKKQKKSKNYIFSQSYIHLRITQLVFIKTFQSNNRSQIFNCYLLSDILPGSREKFGSVENFRLKTLGSSKS